MKNKKKPWNSKSLNKNCTAKVAENSERETQAWSLRSCCGHMWRSNFDHLVSEFTKKKAAAAQWSRKTKPLRRETKLGVKNFGKWQQIATDQELRVLNTAIQTVTTLTVWSKTRCVIEKWANIGLTGCLVTAQMRTIFISTDQQAPEMFTEAITSLAVSAPIPPIPAPYEAVEEVHWHRSIKLENRLSKKWLKPRRELLATVITTLPLWSRLRPNFRRKSKPWCWARWASFFFSFFYGSFHWIVNCAWAQVNF